MASCIAWHVQHGRYTLSFRQPMKKWFQSRQTRSFRVRLVWSTLAYGSVSIGVFALVVWLVIAQDRKTRFHNDLEEVALRFAPFVYGQVTRGLSEAVVSSLGESLEADGWAFAIISREGDMLDSSSGWPEEFPLGWFRGPRYIMGEPTRLGLSIADRVTEDVEAQGKRWRTVSIPGVEHVMLFVSDYEQLDDEMDQLTRAYAFALPLSLLMIALGSAYLSNRAVRPLQKLADSTIKINATGLDQRIALEGEDAEFRRLIEVFNDMLNRLERSFHQAQRFSSDAAHELNNPIAVLMGHIEIALHQTPPESPDYRRFQLLLAEVERLAEIVKKLRMLAQTDTAILKIERQTVQFSHLVRECVENLAVKHEDNLTFMTEIEPEIYLFGDAGLLRQVVINLLSNSIKYNREAGWVEVRLVRESAKISLYVGNSGDPIPDGDRIFDRYFRANNPMHRKKDGLGLGLSLALEFAKAHGGFLELVENRPDRIVFRFSVVRMTF